MAIRGLTVTTPAPSLRLSTLARLKSSLGVTSTTDDAIMTESLDRSSAAVRTYCRREFARQQYTEVGPAHGSIEFLTKEAPVAGLGTVTYNGDVLTDVSVADRESGTLYRRKGFHWTAQSFVGLAGGGRLWDVGTPLPGQEEPLWSVVYTAGFVLPGLDVADTGLSVAATDNSFNHSSSGFTVAALLKAGDLFETAGFPDAANNGRHVISGQPTKAKIVTTSTLALDAGDTSTGRTVVLQSLPYDVEQAALETAKSYYQQRKTDSAVVEKQLGMARLRFAEKGAGQSEPGIPPRAAGLLAPWVRSIP